MKTKLIAVLIISLLICGCAMTPTMLQEEQADYGNYPNNYEDIAKRWIKEGFYDPYSVRDLKISIPVKSWVQMGKTEYGYLIYVTCNAKNRMGGYVGMETFLLLVHNGAVVRGWNEKTTWIKYKR